MDHSADFEPLDLTEKVPPHYGDGEFPDDEVVHVGAPPSPIVVPLPGASALAPLPRGRAADGTRTTVRAVPPPLPSRAIRRATGTLAPTPSGPVSQLDDSWTIRPSVVDLAAEDSDHGNPGSASDPIDRTDHLDRVDLIEDLGEDLGEYDDHAAAPPIVTPAFVAPPLPRPSDAWLARTVSPYPTRPSAMPAHHGAMPTPSPWAQPTPPPPPAQRYERTQLVRSPYHRAMRMAPNHKRIAIGGLALTTVLGIGFAASRSDRDASQTTESSRVAPQPSRAAHARAPAPPVTATNAAIATAPAAVDETTAPEPSLDAPVAAPTAPAARASTPALVRVPITSRPSGASVTLVENGNVSVLGTTPLDVTLDPSRGYDIVLTLKDHPTQIAHVRPTANHPLAVDLTTAAAPRPTTPNATSAAPTAAAHPMPTPARVATATPSPAAPATAATGVLMISTKPPCQIVIDGKPTRLTTPQRALALSAGPHKITLLNPQQKITRTVDVQITAHASTKLIQDFMKK